MTRRKLVSSALFFTLFGVFAFLPPLILLFRFDSRRPDGGRRVWVILPLLAWVLIGGVAERRGAVVAPKAETTVLPPAATYLRPPAAVLEAPQPEPQAAPESAPEAAVRPAPVGWSSVTAADLAEVAFDRLPGDDGIVAPVARFDEFPDPAAEPVLEQLSARLADWAPGHADDPEQRVRNLLCVAAVPDLLQMELVERFIPVFVFQRIRAEVPRDDLARILYWIAFHPDAGDMAACRQLAPLGLPAVSGDTSRLRPRITLYALKLLGRITGDILQQ